MNDRIFFFAYQNFRFLGASALTASPQRFPSRIARTLCTTLLASAAAAVGADVPELITDRPDQTESAHTVPRGLWQLETGWTHSRSHLGEFRTEFQEVPGTLLRIGLSKRFELRVGWGGYAFLDLESPATGSTANRGITDGELGAKALLIEGAGLRPQVALLFATSVPTGNIEFTSEVFDPSFRFSLSHALSPRLDLGYNLGMAWESLETATGGSRLSIVQYTVAIGFALNDTVGAYVEIFGDQPVSPPGRNRLSFDGGFTWGVRDNLQLDLEGGVGLTAAAPDWFVGLGLALRWPR